MTRTADKTVSLQAVKTRAAALADATMRAELAHSRFLEALEYASEDGATGQEIARAIDAVALERPDRAAALARLRAASKFSEASGE